MQHTFVGSDYYLSYLYWCRIEHLTGVALLIFAQEWTKNRFIWKKRTEHSNTRLKTLQMNKLRPWPRKPCALPYAFCLWVSVCRIHCDAFGTEVLLHWAMHMCICFHFCAAHILYGASLCYCTRESSIASIELALKLFEYSIKKSLIRIKQTDLFNWKFMIHISYMTNDY